jgi:hypothetical protein
MKKGVILFHSNIRKLYQQRWIDKCIETLIYQTDNNFTFYEINYEGDSYSVLEDVDTHPKKFWSVKLSNHAEAMNFILDKAFEDGCDMAFNVNLDDYYCATRIEKQSQLIDIVSSNFYYVEDHGRGDIVTGTMLVNKYVSTQEDIKKALLDGHNSIAHPAVCYSKKFWENNRYDPTQIPKEDLELWKQAGLKGYNFYIHNDILLCYRLHTNQVTKRY